MMWNPRLATINAQRLRLITRIELHSQQEDELTSAAYLTRAIVYNQTTN